ncbi:MAG: hypothetical protein IJE72_04620 [Clostridia bacterium]|nr:hypothetical protein [Clostridia bacterium]
MENTKFYLGIDGGGSKTTAVVFNDKGEFICKACGESINYYSVGIENARKAMTDIMKSLSQNSFDCAVIGMSALNERATEEETDRFCKDIINSKKIIMDSDLYVALEAMDIESECAVVISGTGSMALRRKTDGTVSHAGGWGYILGDEGSGYSIGLSGIKAAIRSAEGCEEKTALTDECLSYFSIENIYDLIDLYYDKTVSRKTTAAFAKNVIALAENGDRTAELIVKHEAKMLSKTVSALLIDAESKIPIGLWGGVFQNSKYFCNIFTTHLKSDGFANVKLINFTPEVGAIFACFKENGIKDIGIIKKNILSTYKPQFT